MPRTRKPKTAPRKKTEKPTADPLVELRDAVLQMSKEIEEAVDEDREWTSWRGNGTNSFEAAQVIRPLAELAKKCS
jgi:hypothetical protein